MNIYFLIINYLMDIVYFINIFIYYLITHFFIFLTFLIYQIVIYHYKYYVFHFSYILMQIINLINLSYLKMYSDMPNQLYSITISIVIFDEINMLNFVTFSSSILLSKVIYIYNLYIKYISKFTI
jgi:hypothetical protein